MSCSEHLDRIQELVDGRLGSIRRAELEQHLAACDACRALRDDLQRIHDAAAALPAMRPPDGAWIQIAGRLRQEGRTAPALDAPASPARHSYTWLSLAAALVVATGVSVLLLFRSTPTPPATPAPPPAGNAVDTKAVEAIQSEVDSAQHKFESAIAKMDELRKANMDKLDQQTSEVIEKNLGILDRAIAENRAAVKAEPTSVAARATLFEALRQKVSLLQDTMSIINELGKGNNAGVAQRLNKS